MPRRRRTSAQALAANSLDLSVAAPQVVAYRVGRMLRAGPVLSKRDSAEFARMGSEKVFAFYEAWAAMWTRAAAAQFDVMRSLYGAPPLTPGAFKRRMRRSANAQARSITGVLNAGLEPVRATAVSNARRLGRKVK